jgi:hypothetical protein
MKIRIVRPQISDLRITLGQMARYAGGSKYEMDEKMKKVARPILEKAKRLIEPVFTYSIYGMSELDEESRAVLTGPVENFEKSADAPAVCICLCTLGKELETVVGEMAKRGNALDAAFLDATGVGLLETLGNMSFSSVREEAKKMDMFPGCRIGPGYGGTPLETQKIIFPLVYSQLAGVSLSDSCVMSPGKSLSYWVVFHSTPQAEPEVYKCGACGLADCHYRIKCVKF